MARVLIAAIADRGLGAAPKSIDAYSNLAASNGAVLIDLIEGWMSGAVPCAIRAAVFQISPEPAVTVIGADGIHLNFGPERSRDAAARNVIVSGGALAAIALEFRGTSPREADEQVAISRLRAALN
jgi:hypothetical protein